MDQRNPEKNQKFSVLNDKWFFCLLTFNTRVDIIARYNFNQVRCFLLHLAKISWDGIQIIDLMGYTSKYVNNNTNIYVCTGYFKGFTFLKNVVLLVKLVVLNS